jgi:hypothetical protein
MQVVERKSFNITIRRNANNNVNVGLNVPFQPDEVIVKHFSFFPNNNIAGLFQVGTDMVADGVLFIFPHGNASCTSELSIPFTLHNFSQNRIWNFQIQDLPVNGNTGAGVVSTTCDGTVSFILEFVKYAPPNKK